MRLIVLLLCAITIAAKGQATAPPADFVKRAGQWMISPDPAKRKAAYRSWLQLGEGAMDAYEKALRISLKYHDKKIDKLARGEGFKNPYEPHDTAYRELEYERERVMKLIRTDWKKDGRKIAMLRKEMEFLTKLHKKVNKLATVDTRGFDEAFDGAVLGMVEATRELERFEEEPDSADWDDEDLRDEIVTNHIEGSHIADLRRQFQTSAEAITKLATINEANQKLGPWASSAMKDFAKVINFERDVCGLTPLRLEEKLSDAAKGHSADMARLGFFAHESPVPNKKTPWDRARLAKFAGNASGENIYMGSANPQDAYDAWFGSDGHRFIMFASGPNILAVGISGSHWTMMTGSMN